MSNPGGAPSASGYRERSGWTGWVFFAGVVMIMMGIFHIFNAIVAFAKNNYYVVTANLTISWSYTTWGWVLLIFGIIALCAGFAVMVGALWARIVGIIVAGISMIVNLAWFQALPLLSLIIIAMDVLIIYALAVHGGELKE